MILDNRCGVELAANKPSLLKVLQTCWLQLRPDVLLQTVCRQLSTHDVAHRQDVAQRQDVLNFRGDGIATTSLLDLGSL